MARKERRIINPQPEEEIDLSDLELSADETDYVETLIADGNPDEQELRELIAMRRRQDSGAAGAGRIPGVGDYGDRDGAFGAANLSSPAPAPARVNITLPPSAASNGARAYTAPTAPVVVPLASAVARPPLVPPLLRGEEPSDAVQILVQWVNAREGGKLVNLGELGIDATAYDLLSKWRLAGSYRLTPIDALGNQVAMPVPCSFDERHEVFLDASASRSANGGVSVGSMNSRAPQSAAPGGLSPEALALIKEIREEAERRISAVEARMIEKEKRLDAEREELQKQRVHMATESTNVLLAKIGDVDAKSEKITERSMTQMQTFMQMQVENNRAFFTAMMEQSKAEREAERDRIKHEEKRREEARAEERLRDKERADHERQLNREHTQAMHALNEKRVDLQLSGSSLPKQVEQIVALKGLFGELVPTAPGGGEPKSTLGEIRELVGDVIKLQMERERMQLELAKAGIGAGQPTEDAEEVDDDEDEDDEDSESVADFTPAPQLETRAPAPESFVHEEATQRAPRGVRVHPDVAKLGADVQKSARVAIRYLVRRLRETADRARWTEIVVAGIQQVPAIIQYTQAAGVHNAVVECGAKEPLATEITAAVFGSGLVPSDFPRTR